MFTAFLNLLGLRRTEERPVLYDFDETRSIHAAAANALEQRHLARQILNLQMDIEAHKAVAAAEMRAVKEKKDMIQALKAEMEYVKVK